MYAQELQIDKANKKIKYLNVMSDVFNMNGGHSRSAKVVCLSSLPLFCSIHIPCEF